MQKYSLITLLGNIKLKRTSKYRFLVDPIEVSSKKK